MSTPATEAGKAASSQNGVTNGLFTASDFIRPGEQTAYHELQTELLHELAPVGVLETNLVDEIRRAMWRLRRCGEVEGHLVIGLDTGRGFIFGPMEGTHPDAEKIQRSVDRARAQAHRLLHKCTSELRKLQTARHSAQEFSDAASLGIADYRAVIKARSERTRAEIRQKKREALDNVIPIDQKAAKEAAAAPFTTRTQSEA